MKNLLLATLVTLLLAGALCAGTNPVLSTNAETVFVVEGSSPAPLCDLGDLCRTSQFGLASGDGAPMPTCDPGRNCGNNTQFQLRAGDGAPMPTCDPGRNCGNNTQFQLRAGDGAPMPTCDPGRNCGNNTQFQLRAGDGAPMPTITIVV